MIFTAPSWRGDEAVRNQVPPGVQAEGLEVAVRSKTSELKAPVSNRLSTLRKPCTWLSPGPMAITHLAMLAAFMRKAFPRSVVIASA